MKKKIIIGIVMLVFCILGAMAIFSVSKMIEVLRTPQATIPYSNEQVIGCNIKDIQNSILDAGFDNVSIYEINTDEGRNNVYKGYVKQMTLNGNLDYHNGDKYKINTPIVIYYYNMDFVNGQAESLMHTDSNGCRPIHIDKFNKDTDSYLNNSYVSLSGNVSIEEMKWCYNHVFLGAEEDEVYIDGEDKGTVNDFINEHSSDTNLMRCYSIRISSNDNMYNVYADIFCNQNLDNMNGEVTVSGKFNNAWVLSDTIDDVFALTYKNNNNCDEKVAVQEYECHYDDKYSFEDDQTLYDIDVVNKETNNRVKEISIHKKDGVIYETANDIVYLYNNTDGVSKDDYEISGNVCITGKLKKYSLQIGTTNIPVQGEYNTYNIYSTEDDLYIDDEQLSSSIGIQIDVDTGFVESALSESAWLIANAETYGSTTNTCYIPTKFSQWVQSQKDCGNWNDNIYLRAWGTGTEGWLFYSVKDCYKIDILDSNQNVIATWNK